MVKRSLVLPAAMLLAVVCVSASAKTTAWTGGGGSTDFSTADNWDNGAPAPGDIVTISTASVNLTGSFDMGSAGLTIETSADTTCSVVFSGSGTLVKRGANVLAIQGGKWTGFSGKIRVENGTFQVDVVSSHNHFGSGSFELVATGKPSTKGYALLYLPRNPTYIDEPVSIVGELAEGESVMAIYCGNPSVMQSISSEVDFTLTAGYGNLTIKGDVVAPGRTVTCDVKSYGLGGDYHTIRFEGEVNASIKKVNYGRITLAGFSTNSNHTLTIDTSIIIDPSKVKLNQITGFWGGDVVVRGTSSVLRVSGARCDSLALSDGAKLNMAEGHRLLTRAFSVDGVSKAAGIYSASNCPDAFVQYGSVVVLGGEKRDIACCVWKGGASGSWTDSTKWSPRVPQPGDVARFTNNVTVTAASAIATEDAVAGKSGILFDVENFTVNLDGELTGAGKLVVAGDTVGQFVKKGLWPDFSGDIDIYNGLFQDYPPSTSTVGGIGTGTIRIFANLATLPYFDERRYNTTISNRVEVKGTIPMTKTITVGDVTTFAGAFSSEVDCKLSCGWGQMRFKNGFSAPGHTVTLYSANSSTLNGFVFEANSPLDCSIIKEGYNPLSIAAFASTAAASEATLSFNGGTNTLSQTSVFGGQSVTVGANAMLKLMNGATLPGKASLSVASGGKVNVVANRAAVSAFTVGGTAMRAGIYGRVRLPDVIEGDGTIRVGTLGFCVNFR